MSSLISLIIFIISRTAGRMGQRITEARDAGALVAWAGPNPCVCQARLAVAGAPVMITAPFYACQY